VTTVPSLSIVVFAYNESQNLAPVLSELRIWLREHEPDAEIIVVDDGSTDATYEIARKTLYGTSHRVLRHQTNRGIGAALKTGVAAATAPWVTFLPADGQIEPASVGTLRAEARRSRADTVGRGATPHWINPRCRPAQ
jgi:dolichol-phosphate mannosyltransferase